MDSKYFKELESYKKHYLLNEIGENVFEELLDRGILKSEDDRYKFKYVGLIVLKDIILNCYPKYIKNENNISNDFNEIVKVIKHYFDINDVNSIKTFDYGIDNLDNIPFNLVSVMLFFIEDYYENGVYTSYQNMLSINGNGEINWNRTVNETLPIIKNNKPFYTELITRDNYNDIFDYFRLLHEYVITDCSNYLKNNGLLDIFGFTSVELSENVIDNFGSKSYILNKISKRLNIEFNTHKRKLLHLMYTYIKHRNSLTEDNSLIIYGTRSYHLVWEDICKKVFGSLLEEKLQDLFPDKNYSLENTLKSIIEYPKWILDKKEYDTEGTLIPDIVTFYKNKQCKNQFIIFDAKYYQYELKEDKITHQPGIRSVIKQYLYHLAYKDFIEEHEFDNVKNAFLLPKYEGEVENKGKVVLNILSNLKISSKSGFKLEDIQVILLPAKLVNKRYLNNETMEISELKLDKNDKFE